MARNIDSVAWRTPVGMLAEHAGGRYYLDAIIQRTKDGNRLVHILVINCGSSSVKFKVIDSAGGRARSGKIECGGGTDQRQAVDDILQQVGDLTIDAVGHRVVHGGEAFRSAVVIDDEVLSRIEALSHLAPLHNPHNVAGIRAAMAAMPDLPQVACFDTAFHHTLPRRAATYALDAELTQRKGIRRYGFHGHSHQIVAERAAAFLGRDLKDLRLVSLHLGNGASACAIEWGHSTETSMGMTPLEGLVMGTRCGDVDPGALLSLLRDESLDADALDELLNRSSGLAGLSGLGNDLRAIESAAADGNDRARLAITVFAHRVRKYIGAYAAAMGGLDAVILTGGIGENGTAMRQRVLQRLDFLGLAFDDIANQDARVSDDHPVSRVSQPQARVQALVVKTNEEAMIARQTADLLAASEPCPGPIPIAVSGRHLHLDRATFARLFGEDAEPTPDFELSQPGQYACKERVNLIGPRNRIDGVRLLGPLRSKNQIEISRTDEFALGVDAPVRDSGRVKASAPITLEGPHGTVHLSEGLICARRHIHMHSDDARRYRVKSGDEVEVAIVGGPRDLIFGDVLIRVSPAYRLEMHIDTDEANAAELPRSSDGELVYTGVEGAVAKLKASR